MPRINKSLPLAAFLAVGARAQLSTSSVVLNTADTAVTTVTYSTCPSFTASVTTITNPHMSTYTGGAARPGDMTTYVTVCQGFCTGAAEGLCPTTHTVTATCPCNKATPDGMGPGMTQTVAVCPTCGPGGSPMTATVMTPIPGATGGAAPGAAPVGSAPGAGAPAGSLGYAPDAGAAPGAPGASMPATMGSAPGGSAPGAGAPGAGAPGAAAPGGSMPGMGAAGKGAASPSGVGAGAGSNYGNSSNISPSISPAMSSPAMADSAARLPLVGGLLSTVAGLCGVLAFIL